MLLKQFTKKFFTRESTDPALTISQARCDYYGEKIYNDFIYVKMLYIDIGYLFSSKIIHYSCFSFFSLTVWNLPPISSISSIILVIESSDFPAFSLPEKLDIFSFSKPSLNFFIPYDFAPSPDGSFCCF